MHYVLHPTGIKASMASDARRRALLIRRIRRIRNRLEKTLRQRLADELASQREDLGAVDPNDLVSLAEVVELHQSRLERIISASLRELYPLIAELVIPDDAIKQRAQYETKAVEDELDARINTWMTTMLGIQIRDISSSTLTRVRELALESGGSPELFRRKLEDSGLFGDIRARRIAVTEMTAGINQCQHEAAVLYAPEDETVWKTWTTTGMLNVRETHRQMNGVRIKEDELFEVPNPNGGIDYMEYPGDSTHGASAANIVNCHCLVFYTTD